MSKARGLATIIAGGRDFSSEPLLTDSLALCSWEVSEVVSGRAAGADKMGEQWAQFNNIPISFFPAKWDQYGKSAGYKRNAQMAEYAQALIAFWDGKSKGTKMMIDLAIRQSLVVQVIRYG